MGAVFSTILDLPVYPITSHAEKRLDWPAQATLQWTISGQTGHMSAEHVIQSSLKPQYQFTTECTVIHSTITVYGLIMLVVVANI